MKLIINYIKQKWLTLIITILPILDIITYFFIESKISSIFTLLRLMLMVGIFIYSFRVAKEKKYHIIFTLVVFVYTLFHMISCFYSGYMSLYEDLSNLLRIYNMPVLLFSFVMIFKNKDNYEKDVIDGIKLAFFITVISIIISWLTNTANYTYGTNIELGIIGWFFNKNSQSLILIILCFITGAYSLKKKSFYVISLIITIFLYFNATKSAYLSLLAYLLMTIFYSFFEAKNKKKTIFSFLLLLMIILSFEISPTYKNLNGYIGDQKIKNETIENSNINNKVPVTKPPNQNNEENKIVEQSILDEYEALYRKYGIGTLIDNFGIEKVVDKYHYSTDSFELSNVRTRKKIAASLIYDEENFGSHLFGFEFTKINNMTNKSGKVETFDLENDFTALFYYLGYVGFALYVSFILYFIIKSLILLLNNFNYIFKIENIVWFVLILLLCVGAEYNGSLLRRPNANIYLALITSIAYIKLAWLKKNIKSNKISFLTLHLGYGGIETSTINTANALINDYDVEIISFYHLNNDQEKLLNKKVKVKYLYDGEPNREKFLNNLKEKKLFMTFIEGLKSFKILLLKKYLLINEIISSDSKFIVSTRWDFSILLSKYKSKSTIAIAQEHHHHNNNQKYIKVLKNKYKKIDYLFALTNSLAKDYNEFLKHNKNIKIVVVPNMLIYYPDKISELKYDNVIYVGRLHKGKKVADLIDIVDKTKNVKKFYIIGDGEDYNELNKIIKLKKLENKIDLLGYKNQLEIGKYLRKSSIFVLSSISEGLPMVLLEAMSYGIPCIAFRTDSGISDIIINNKNGYIIDYRDKEEFSKKIDYLLNDKVLIKTFSKNAIKKSQEFSSSNILKIWNQILKS